VTTAYGAENIGEAIIDGTQPPRLTHAPALTSAQRQQGLASIGIGGSILSMTARNN
jgi:hypothetical protein